MFRMSSYEKVYTMRKSFTYIDTLFKWHLICLFSQLIQEPSHYSCLEGPGWTLTTLKARSLPMGLLDYSTAMCMGPGISHQPQIGTLQEYGTIPLGFL